VLPAVSPMSMKNVGVAAGDLLHARIDTLQTVPALCCRELVRRGNAISGAKSWLLSAWRSEGRLIRPIRADVGNELRAFPS